MGLKTKGAYCKACQKHVMAQKNAPNHLLHLILTVLTFGLWAVVWLIIAITTSGGYRCTQCGQLV